MNALKRDRVLRWNVARAASRAAQVLACQAHALLRRLARIRDALVVPVPIVVSLDLNAAPDSLAYRALHQGPRFGTRGCARDVIWAGLESGCVVA